MVRLFKVAVKLVPVSGRLCAVDKLGRASTPGCCCFPEEDALYFHDALTVGRRPSIADVQRESSIYQYLSSAFPRGTVDNDMRVTVTVGCRGSEWI
jgi:hypothetical protein